MLHYSRNVITSIYCLLTISLCYGQPAGNKPASTPATNPRGCEILFKTDFADKEPVILKSVKNSYEIFTPENSGISLKANDEITLSCPGGSNKLTGLNKDVATAKCVQGKTITVDGKQVQFNTVACDKRTSGQYLDTTEPCGKRGVKKYLGHKVGEKWLTIIDVCYDQKNGQTLYTKHILHGSAVGSGKDSKTEGNFKVGGLEFRVKGEQIYGQANLKKIFTKLLGTTQLADQYISAQSGLVRLQLSPKSDFVYSSSAYLPYFYINTVPQWQQINSGNWKTLEDAIHKTASVSKENFKIITGGHDVLTLKDKNNNDAKIYLDDLNTLPVPKFIWKVMYSLNTKKAIAFVNLNNPFVKSLTAADNLCTDVCEKYGWKNAAWKDIAKGAIYCCDVKQLMEKVKSIPNFGDVSGILEGKVNSPAAGNTKPAARPNSQGCTFNYKTDFPDKEPVLLKKIGSGYEILPPENDAISLNPQQEVSLFCPGSSNKITKLNKNLVSATCVSDKNLKIDGKNYKLKDLDCNQRVNSEYKLTTKECSGNGIIKNIGHKINDNSFVSLVDVCYDHRDGAALYSEHTLYGSAVDNGKVEKQTIDYKVGGLEFRVNAEDDFKTANQKTLFEKLLGSKELASKYINTDFLARAHLSPIADFVFGSSKYTSNFYINSVPEWQSINNGNWKSLENSVRATASSLKKPFDIITGGFGTLELKDTKGKNVPIYLDIVKTLPVPKFIWKIMYSPETRKGIAFVVLNNPFVDTVTKDDYICPNICKNHGWGTPEWEKKEKGLLYCCEVKELLKVVDTVPTLGPVDGIQEGKK